eukprot:4008589-Prymnesium_polylepis.1
MQIVYCGAIRASNHVVVTGAVVDSGRIVVGRGRVNTAHGVGEATVRTVTSATGTTTRVVERRIGVKEHTARDHASNNPARVLVGNVVIWAVVFSPAVGTTR